MTTLDQAIRHAQTVDAIEQCAPPVTATYLEAAYRRMKLPLGATYHERSGLFSGLFEVWERGLDGRDTNFRFRATADSATRAYLSLCHELLAASSQAGPLAAGASDDGAEGGDLEAAS